MHLSRTVSGGIYKANTILYLKYLITVIDYLSGFEIEKQCIDRVFFQEIFWFS
jgi:hypothetical protein